MKKKRKQLIRKKKISRECWSLNSSFLNWLRVHLPVYLKEADCVVDLTYDKFVHRGSEYTLKQLIERMITLLASIEKKGSWDGDIYYDTVDEILDIWKLVFHAMWW